MLRAVFAAAFAAIVGFAGLAQAAPAPTTLTDARGVMLLEKPVYRFSGGPVSSFASGPSDWLVIGGSASKTVRVTNLTLCLASASAGPVVIQLLRHSTADTTGTSSAVTAGVLDPANDPAATASVVVYSANPTVGTLLGGPLDTYYLTPGGCASTDFGTRNGQAAVLRGTAQQLAVSLLQNSSMPSGAALTYRLEETEGSPND